MAEPDWWKQALALEKEDRIEEAEKLVGLKMAALGGPSDWQIAELYRLRAFRLSDFGNEAGAREAAKKAIANARSYASGATSGGEGTARSTEVEEFAGQLRHLL